LSGIVLTGACITIGIGLVARRCQHVTWVRGLGNTTFCGISTRICSQVDGSLGRDRIIGIDVVTGGIELLSDRVDDRGDVSVLERVDEVVNDFRNVACVGKVSSNFGFDSGTQNNSEYVLLGGETVPCSVIGSSVEYTNFVKRSVARRSANRGSRTAGGAAGSIGDFGHLARGAVGLVPDASKAVGQSAFGERVNAARSTTEGSVDSACGGGGTY